MASMKISRGVRRHRGRRWPSAPRPRLAGGESTRTLLLTHSIETLEDVLQSLDRGIGKTPGKVIYRRRHGVLPTGCIQFRTLNAFRPRLRATRAKPTGAVSPGIGGGWKQPTCDLSAAWTTCSSKAIGDRVPFSSSIPISLSPLALSSGLIHVGLRTTAAGREPGGYSRCRDSRVSFVGAETGTPPRLIAGRDLSVMEVQPAIRRNRCSPLSASAACIRGSCLAGYHTTSAAKSFREHSIARRCSRRDPRCRTALFPVHRGQGASVRRQGEPPDLHRAGELVDHELYPNGISTSLPFDVQLELCTRFAGWTAHIVSLGRDRVRLFLDPGTCTLRSRRSRCAGCSSPADQALPV